MSTSTTPAILPLGEASYRAAIREHAKECREKANAAAVVIRWQAERAIPITGETRRNATFAATTASRYEAEVLSFPAGEESAR